MSKMLFRQSILLFSSEEQSHFSTCTMDGPVTCNGYLLKSCGMAVFGDSRQLSGPPPYPEAIQ